MHNNNHNIDQQMREVLESGGERLNLGAWANMERMLDGQNPYAVEEEEKKKRGFWLFGVIALAISILSVGAYQLFSTHTKPTNEFAQNKSTDKVMKSATDDKATQPLDNTALPATNTALLSSNTEANINNNDYSENKTPHKITPIPKEQIAINATVNLDVTPTIHNSANNNSIENPVQSTNTKTNHLPSIQSKVALVKNVNDNTNKQINAIKTVEINNNKPLSNTIYKESIIANKGVKTIIANKEKNNSNIIEPSNEEIALEKLPIIAQSTLPKTELKPKDSVTFITKILSLLKNDDGELIPKEIVTVNKVENKNKLNDAIKENVPVENVRLVKLTPAEQTKADAKPNKTNKKIIVKAKDQKDSVNNIVNNTIATPEEITPTTIDAKPKVKVVSTPNWADKAIENLVETTRKLGYIKVFNQKIFVNPGIFAGINASVFKTDHNYGGFQAGTNLMMQIAKNWSILPQVGFYYRNNAGYSIKDNSTTISNKSSFISTDGKSYIYNHQIDSVNTNYNFKHMYNIEAPIVLQYHLKDLAIYGGVNLAYGFRMITTDNQRTYTNIITTTIPKDSVFTYPDAKSTFYKSTDFQSRFGVGYVAGFSFDFHPNMYIDARITQNIWDNSGTVSAIAMSNKMFRVPSIQIGVAYRFKERERARY